MGHKERSKICKDVHKVFNIKLSIFQFFMPINLMCPKPPKIPILEDMYLLIWKFKIQNSIFKNNNFF